MLSDAFDGLHSLGHGVVERIGVPQAFAHFELHAASGLLNETLQLKGVYGQHLGGAHLDVDGRHALEGAVLQVGRARLVVHDGAAPHAGDAQQAHHADDGVAALKLGLAGEEVAEVDPGAAMKVQHLLVRRLGGVLGRQAENAGFLGKPGLMHAHGLSHKRGHLPGVLLCLAHSLYQGGKGSFFRKRLLVFREKEVVDDGLSLRAKGHDVSWGGVWLHPYHRKAW